MIKTKTLLIVGAGASASYGYPTGEKLKNELCDPSNLNDLHSKIHEDVVAEFCQVFRGSQKYSIDAFLAQRGNDYINKSADTKTTCSYDNFVTFEKCGKLAIASQLIKCENLDKLLQPKEDHWLEYLWNLMSANDLPKTEFANNQLKIISFNYDRVIEQYFRTVINNYYDVSFEEAAKLQKSIEIVHVYGNLQDLDERPYGETLTDISTVANCIKVIPEVRNENTPEFQRAKEIIDWADKICFVGFGFDPTNIHRLGFSGSPLSNLFGKRVDGTRRYGVNLYGFTQYGMKKNEIDEAQRLLNGGRILPTGSIGHSIEIKNIEELKTLEYFKQTRFFLENIR